MLGHDSISRLSSLVLFTREAGAAHILRVLRLANAFDVIKVFHFAVIVLLTSDKGLDHVFGTNRLKCLYRYD